MTDELLNHLPPHIRKRITVCEKTGCWLAYGVKPRTRQVDHLCENVACCNPRHLDLVTPSVNCKRRHRRRKKPQ